ncbi:transglutaminaseTgpA domain-containing protein [Oleiharenicola lentus]|uniref:transglutaminase family protein n=1 Tax=Oleiharenicola lentus TaxID=2508720 RepID=UPI003F67F285
MSMASKPRQLNLDELRRLKWLLGGAMSLVAVWTVFFLDIEALTLVGIVTLAVGATLIWPQLPSRVPALVWRLGVPAIIAVAVVDYAISPDTMPVLIRLAVLLVLYRAASYRRKREDLQLIVLGLFLIVVAGVLTVSLGFAFLLLLFTACALGFLFVVTLIDMSEQTATALTYAEMSQSPAWAKGRWRPFFGRMRAVTDWRLLGFASGLFALVVGFSALLFVIIPRFEIAGGYFLDKYLTRQNRTGFTDTIKLGSVSELVQDSGVAMRVDLSDAASLREVPYLRIAVLDEYTKDGFRMSAQLKGQLMRGQRPLQVVRGRARRTSDVVGGTWTFYYEAGVSRFFPLPGSFGTLRLRETTPLQSLPSQQLVALRADPMTMTAFQLDGVVMGDTLRDAEFSGLLQEWARADRPTGRAQSYDARVVLKTPEGAVNEATVKKMLAEITQGKRTTAREFATLATAWLRARHAYARSSNIPSGDGDAIVKWLDSNEVGFCEYFASGLAVLSRAAGHPARVIAGFHGGTLNAFENYYMVRNSDAHAWTEIFDGEGSWLRIDATPGAANTIEAATAQAAERANDSSWSARLDSLRVLWYRRIVNFDSRAQVQMLQQVKALTTDAGAALREKFGAISKQLKTWIGKPWDGKRVARAAVFVLGVGAVAWGLWRAFGWFWSRARGWGRAEKFDPVRRDAGRWLTTMRERGVSAEQSTESARTLEQLRRLRYGRRETWPEPRVVFKQAKRTRKPR